MRRPYNPRLAAARIESASVKRSDGHLSTCTPYCAKTHCTHDGCSNDAAHGLKTCLRHSH